MSEPSSHTVASPSFSSSSSDTDAGGFTPDTEVLTTKGPVKIADLSVGDRVYALNEAVGLVKPKLVRRIDTAPFEGELVTITGKRIDFRLHPAHRVLFQTKGLPIPRTRPAGELHETEYYRFVNTWETSGGARLETVDITDFVDEFEARATTDVHGHTFRAALPDGCDPSYVNSHSGYHFDPAVFKRYQAAIESVADEVSIRRRRRQRTQPYRFDGDDFIELIGWFVTEGSVYWGSAKQTATVQIAQETSVNRRRITSLFERMGISVSVNDRKFRFSSELFGILLESLCGSSSQTKRLPTFVWRLPTDQQRLLLETLLRGDGNEHRTYVTASERLARDVLRLCVEVGVKPRYSRRFKMWRLFLSRGNDGFRASVNVSTTPTQTVLYRLTVADYGTVLAGRNGRFQWIGVSNIS